MRDYILAYRVSGGAPVVESIKKPCVECNEDCWVSRGTIDGAPRGTGVVCTACMMIVLAKSPE